MMLMGSVEYGTHLHFYKSLTLTSYCSNNSAHYLIPVQVLHSPPSDLYPESFLSLGNMSLSLLMLVLLSCLVIRCVFIRYEDTPGTITDLELAQLGLSDGECLLSVETGDTRINDMSSSLKNLANVSAWQLCLLLSIILTWNLHHYLQGDGYVNETGMRTDRE